MPDWDSLVLHRYCDACAAYWHWVLLGFSSCGSGGLEIVSLPLLWLLWHGFSGLGLDVLGLHIEIILGFSGFDVDSGELIGSVCMGGGGGCLVHFGYSLPWRKNRPFLHRKQ